MKNKKTTAKKNSSKYESPKLKKHGSFSELTQAKGGTTNVGASKPASRINGPTA